ncbi:MAG TPA: hypothetical protein VK968_10075 [Roseimicrobium sp.]|nr:hypothetical protein [Roseimicrobium sp.]
MISRKLISSLCCVLLGSASLAADSRTLSNALLTDDLDAIRAAVAQGRIALGDKAGDPEVADEYKPVPKGATMLGREKAQAGFSPSFSKLESMCWWKVGLDPSKMSAPLRAPASVLAGNVAAARAKLDGAGQSVSMAREAAAFLMWAQEQAGAGVYPFPAARGTSDAKAMKVATAFLARAEKEGKLDQIVRNGWAFDDFGEGGLQFDNSECGVAMFELYELTRDTRYLDSARRAADWAASRPLCPNWNYNSFSVDLLAKAFQVTGEKSYLTSAIQKARLGVIPGQLTDGPRAGRWVDPHNARPAYHYIMMRGLARLAGVMPADHGSRPEILNSLKLGLRARNSEMVSRGVMNKDKAMESLLLVNRVFKEDKAFLESTQSVAALQAVALLVSAEAASGKFPLSPGEWGRFLEYVAVLKDR